MKTMTVAEKIIYLRNRDGLSQLDLAKSLHVARQSVSKWENNQASPQLDKIVEICTLFNISADDFINDNVDIRLKTSKKDVSKELDNKEEKKTKNKYFGTDGFRGESNVILTGEHAFKVGRFLGWYYSHVEPRDNNEKPRIVIGKDTRRSSYMLEYAIASGIASSGGNAYILHVTTTPSVAYITRTEQFDCGVMITASHNVFYDNGIKVLNCRGEKLEDKVTALIEAYLDNDLEALGIEGKDIPYATREEIGSVIDYIAGRNRYIGYLISLVSQSFRGLKIGLDCANGASWNIARSVFNAVGADVYAIGVEPDGTNTNKLCGSTKIDNLCRFVKEKHLDVGFAFDGDADRCIAVDEKGKVVDGDVMIYILACSLKDKGALTNNTVVNTIMSNSGALKAFKDAGIKTEQTTVGDRFVYERMLQKNYVLGGEQSGHIIIKKYATTGDGILTALMITEEMIEKHKPLSRLAAPVHLYPQLLKNVRVIDKSLTVNDKKVLAKVDEINKALGDDGRILLRESGTEPVVRIMVEADDENLCNKYIQDVYELIEKGGYICE